MSNQTASPFGRSQLLQRSPPPTPNQPEPVQPIEQIPPQAPAVLAGELPPEVVSTPDIQKWIGSIDAVLAEVCTIVSEGKMNNDQKQRVSALCRNVLKGTSQMAVEYQALKQKTIQAHHTVLHLKEQLDLAESIKVIKNTIIDKLSPSDITSSSYANIVKKSSETLIRPANLSSVAIYPCDKTRTSEDTKSLVQKIISPEELKLHVRGLKKVRNGGVLIRTENKGDIEKLRNSTKLMSSGLTVEETPKRRPRIAVVGVPVALTEREVFDCIYEQNLSEKLANSTRESFLATVKLSHKSGKKGLPTCNYILEVSAAVRKVLINQGRIFINWTSCPVRDFTIVTRCFNCQQFGHAAKFCRETSPTCNHCGETGHSHKECNSKSSPPQCATCKRFKKKCDHQTGDAECPARKYAEINYINSIDYEGA
ncbi:uncharacterized protein LOC126912615 [Spodoptera frugiperda]|uniref:Uncharacterized protein LOC126912615 n=1 Tax=Spodoptera frugiperda TaxID=7108 RepID=A0A9R0EAS9_SPOFR|nr:uncharacterized protein LOC126912615 [Spodoptera frugiperda]